MLAGWSLGVVELIGGGRDGTELRAEASCSWVATGRRLAGCSWVASRDVTSQRGGNERLLRGDQQREKVSRRRRRDGLRLRRRRDGPRVSDGDGRCFHLLSREREAAGGMKRGLPSATLQTTENRGHGLVGRGKWVLGWPVPGLGSK
ncbi:unnamed protein product [Linum trigynum]|uniref:Uncharacterized protein n=1 Tax=Linum trigynum TaxID=586398 RepID=A0AAV2DYP6_9ROSI